MKKYGIIALAMVLLIGIFLWLTMESNSYDAVDYELLPPGEPATIAVIDGEPFRVNAAREAFIMWSMLDENISVSKQVEYVVEQEVIARSAQKAGVTVSDAEVQAFVDDQLQNHREYKKEEAGQDFYVMLDTMGVTDEEFYQMFFELYRSMLLAGKYREQVTEAYEKEAFEKWKKRRAAGTEEEFAPDSIKYWQDVKEDLIGKADIEYIIP